MSKKFLVGSPCKLTVSNNTFLGRIVENINSLFHFSTPHGSVIFSVETENLETISHQEYTELMCFEGDAIFGGNFYNNRLGHEEVLEIIRVNESFRKNT